MKPFWKSFNPETHTKPVLNKEEKNKPLKYEAVVMGVSAGGFDLLEQLIPALPHNLKIPIFVVQHQSASAPGYLPSLIAAKSKVPVKHGEEGETIKGGIVYIAPPNSHMLISPDKNIVLSKDPPVHHSRPSIDVTFNSAALAYQHTLIGFVLTGANYDGSMGLRNIYKQGGLTIVQDPNEAAISIMPREALRKLKPDFVMNINDMIDFMKNINNICSNKLL